MMRWLATSVACAAMLVACRQAPDWILEGPVLPSGFGHTVTVGDLDGDGASDIVVLARVSGRVFVFQGRFNGVAGPVSDWGAGNEIATIPDVNGDGRDELWVDGSVWYGQPDGLRAIPDWISGRDAGAECPMSGSIGADVDGDGFGDLIGEADGGDGVHRICVHYGSASGLNGDRATMFRDPRGSSVRKFLSAAGDVNGDGADDLVIAWSGGNTTIARLSIHLGSPAGLDPTASWTREIEYTARPAAGDVNGDGFDDLAVISGFDEIVLFLGGPDGLDPEPAMTVSGQGRFLSLPSMNRDINGDGFADLAVNASAEPRESVAVYRGGPDGLEKRPWWRSKGEADVTGLVTSLATGDINGDGFADVLVGKSGLSGLGRGRGSVEVFLGRAE